MKFLQIVALAVPALAYTMDKHAAGIAKLNASLERFARSNAVSETYRDVAMLVATPAAHPIDMLQEYKENRRIYEEIIDLTVRQLAASLPVEPALSPARARAATVLTGFTADTPATRVLTFELVARPAVAGKKSLDKTVR